MTEGKNIEKKELSALEQKFNEIKDFEVLYQYSDEIMEEMFTGIKLDSCHIIESTHNSQEAKNGVNLYKIIQVGDFENGEHRLFSEQFDLIEKKLDDADNTHTAIRNADHMTGM